MPPWTAAAAANILWPFLEVLICEFSRTRKDQCIIRAGGLEKALRGNLTAQEMTAVSAKIAVLVAEGASNHDGERGRCHMSLVVGAVLKLRSHNTRPGPKDKMDPIDQIIKSFALGLCPKSFWFNDHCSQFMVFIFGKIST